MQIHSRANEIHSNNSVDEFWRLVDSINWPEQEDATAVKRDLMKQMGPASAKKTRAIALYYIMHLVNAFNEWHSNEDRTVKISLYDLERAISNVIGGGRLNYDEYFRKPVYLVSEIESLNRDNSFLSAIPSEDEYFSGLNINYD